MRSHSGSLVAAPLGMTRLFPIAAMLRILLSQLANWIPACAGMTRLFPIAVMLRILLSDIRVT